MHNMRASRGDTAERTPCVMLFADVPNRETRRAEGTWHAWQAALKHSAQTHKQLLGAEARANYLANLDACNRTPRAISVDLAPETAAARKVRCISVTMLQ